MIKRTYILLVAITVSTCHLAASGQDKEEKIKGKHRRIVEEADFFYGLEDHYMSRELYRELIELYPDNMQFNFRLGYSYLNIRNEEKMAIPYLEVSARNEYTPAFYFLAEAYHLNEQFHKALDALDKYRNRPDKQLTHARIDRVEEKIETAMDMMGYPIEVEIKKLGDHINSDHQDYAPNIDPEGEFLYYTSRRPESTGGFRDPDGNYFEDIFVSKCVSDSWTAAEPLPRPINNDGHDANVNFAPSGNRMIIYRTHKNMISGDLYISDRVREGWSEPQLMGSKVNTPNYNEPSAAFSPDEQEIYIVSDRPGGFGGKDIYVIRKLPTGEWAEPHNLGREINSPFDEDAPFLSLDGQTLYYASMGNGSIGGYDIFRSSKDELGEWDDPHHLGYPINSVYDDIYFSLTADAKRGFLSTSREGNMDIYEVNMLYETEDLVVIKGYVTDGETKEVVKGRISITDRLTGQEMVSVIPNTVTGKYVAAILPDKNYTLHVNAEGYESQEKKVKIQVEEKGEFEVLEMDIQLTKVKGK
ncbi:MAG: hypothetical protein HKN45_00255 [Flavobacteriales bacterium]|nr:hypothetical protein [Flavobacteriales bacterium]